VDWEETPSSVNGGSTSSSQSLPAPSPADAEIHAGTRPWGPIDPELSTAAKTRWVADSVYGLTVAIDGGGYYEVDPSRPYHYNHGQQVTVTARALPGWEFSAWSGDITASQASTTLTMDAHKRITVTFTGSAPTELVVYATPDVVRVGEPVTLTAIARDASQHSWNVTEQALFAIEPGAGGTWEGNVYTSEVPGRWTVSAEYGGLTGEYTLTVRDYRVLLPLVARN
jgi:hypothetical protein